MQLNTPFESDKFVTIQKARGNDVRWETFAKTMVFFEPNPRGMTSPRGALRNGIWGIEHRVEVGDNGVMEVPSRYVKFAKRPARN